MRQAARIDDLVARFAAIRETVGWQIDLGVELHRNMTVGDAVLSGSELARLRPLFVEDPIPPDSVAALRAFAAKVAVPSLPVNGTRRSGSSPSTSSDPESRSFAPMSGSRAASRTEEDLRARPSHFTPACFRTPSLPGRLRSPRTSSSACALRTGRFRSMCRRSSPSWTDLVDK